MKNLIEIVDVVKKIRLKSADLLLVDERKKTQPQQFFDKLVDGSLKTDDEAAMYFFNTDKRSSKYKNLKRYLKNKLLSTLLFIEPRPTYGDYNNTYLYCCKNLFAAKILINLGARNSGIELCQKVFQRAQKVELTEFVLNAGRYLRLHFGSRMGDVEKFEYYNAIFKEHQEIERAENLSEEYYTILMMPYVKSKAQNEETQKIGKQFYQELKPYLERYSSPFLHFYSNYIRVISFLSVNEYQDALAACEEAIAFFNNKDYTYKTPLRVFFHTSLIVHTQLRNYEKGKEIALKTIDLVLPGTHSWYVNRELFLVLALHSKEYQEAYHILVASVNHPKFKFLSNSLQERWLIYKAYISFLAEINKLSIAERELKNFRLKKFLNSIPTYSKDKRGLNIPIIIIQILFAIARKDYDESIDRFEAIQKYCSRYLRKEESLRSNSFINMLLQIPLSNFHKAGAERRTEKWLKILESTPLHIAKQAYEVEIIPYEDLWGFVMDSLDKKFYYWDKKKK